MMLFGDIFLGGRGFAPKTFTGGGLRLPPEPLALFALAKFAFLPIMFTPGMMSEKCSSPPLKSNPHLLKNEAPFQ